MRLRALFRRLVLPPVAVGLAVTGLALPAQAEESLLDGFPLLMLSVTAEPSDDADGTDTVTVIDGQPKTVRFDVYNMGGADAKNVVISFANGPEPVPADLGFVAPDGCSATACKLDRLASGARHSYSFTLKPDVASTTNLTSYFDVSAKVATEEHAKVTLQVVRTTKNAVDLEIADVKDIKLDRGQSADVPVTVRNSGNVDSGPLGLVMMAQPGVEPLLGYRNCEKDDELEGMICVLDDTLAPGEKATLSAGTPVRVKVGADTPGPSDYYAGVGIVGLTEEYAASFAKRAAARKGAELTLHRAVSFKSLAEDDITEDLNPADNVAEFFVTVGRSEADSKAVGGVFRGTAGDLATVKVGTENLGPTATVPLSLKSISYVRVNVPTNVKLTKVDEWCIPGTSPTNLNLDADLDSRDWVCLVFDQVAKGNKALFTFQAMIQEGSHETGLVQVAGGVQDSAHGNDKAALTVNAGDTGGEGGGLPVTGPSAGLIAGGGGVLLLAGVIAFRMARRRRIVTVVE